MNFLHRFLQTPFFFGSSMFFASGAPAVGGGGGTEGGSGGTDAGGSGGAPPIATWGPPRKEGSDGASERDGREGEGTQAGTEETSESQDFSDFLEADKDSSEDIDSDGHGEQTFKQFVESIRTELTSEDPKVVKQAEKKLKKIHGENQLFHQHFESPEQARELTERLESLGGIEGIETETQEAATLWNMLGAGDPAILDTLAEDHGEGLVKLFNPYFDRMLKTSPTVVAHRVARMVMQDLYAAGPRGEVSAIGALNHLMTIEGVKDSEAFQRVAEVINRIDEIARTAPQGKRDDPTMSKREKEIVAREGELKRNALAGKAAPVLNSSAKSNIEALLNGRKLSPEAHKQVLAWTHDEFAKLAAKDTVGKRNREALLAAGETEKWLKNVKATAKRFMQKAAKAGLRKYAGIAGIRSKQAAERREEGNSRREAGGGGQSGGTIRSQGAPDAKTVDWARMKMEAAKHGFKDHDDMFMSGKYFKKGDARNVYQWR